MHSTDAGRKERRKEGKNLSCVQLHNYYIQLVDDRRFLCAAAAAAAAKRGEVVGEH